jgi:large subunit ribosomal protein LP2
VGVEAEESNITKLIGELAGKNLEELIAEGSKKLASVPSGGGGGAPAAGGGGGGAAAAAAKAEPEPEEEEEEDMGFDLFD